MYVLSFVFVSLKPTDKFLNLIHHAALEPTKKYAEPQTESQEIGWNTTPLVSRVLKDSALCKIQRGSAHHTERYSCKKIICDKHRKEERLGISRAVHGQALKIYT